MADHVYCAVKCKACKLNKVDTCIILKYLGTHDGREEYDIPLSCPLIFSIRCTTCQERESYTRRDVEIIALPEPPPSDFGEQF
jgi:hypothetical protein